MLRLFIRGVKSETSRVKTPEHPWPRDSGVEEVLKTILGKLVESPESKWLWKGLASQHNLLFRKCVVFCRYSTEQSHANPNEWTWSLEREMDSRGRGTQDLNLIIRFTRVEHCRNCPEVDSKIIEGCPYHPWWGVCQCYRGYLEWNLSVLGHGHNKQATMLEPRENRIKAVLLPNVQDANCKSEHQVAELGCERNCGVLWSYEEQKSLIFLIKPNLASLRYKRCQRYQ